MATALDNSHTSDFAHMAIRVQQLQDNNGNAVNMTELQPLTGITSSVTEVNRLNSTVSAATTGVLATAPTSGTVTASHQRFGPFVQSTFVLTAARVPHTDAGASGSSGSLALFTFPEGAIQILGSRLDISAVAINSTCVTTSAVGVWGLGTVAVAAAADGALATTSVDIALSSAMTLSSGTGAVETISRAGLATTSAINGTATAGTMTLNESFTAATSSSNGSLDVTATITVIWALMGDD